MVVYALSVSVVITTIRRSGLKNCIIYGLKTFLIMVAGALLFGWLMFLFIKK